MIDNNNDSEEEYEQARLLEKTSVLTQIRQAFHSMDYPGDDNIFAYIRSENEEFANELRGKNWQDIMGGFIQYNFDDIYLLSPQGFRYYLPAWLMEALSAPPGNMALFAIVNYLTPPPYGVVANEEKFLTYIDPLSIDQKRAILAFFNYLSEDFDDPDDQYVQALTYYWKRFA